MQVADQNVFEVPAREAKNRFGKILDDSQHHDVIITKNGRPHTVMMSFVSYQKTANHNKKPKKNIMDYMGCGGLDMKDVPDPVTRIRMLRDEWD